MSKKIFVTRGLPASGKSTWARKVIDKNQGLYKRVNKDDLRAMIDNGHWSKKNEKFIIQIRDLIVQEALKSGYIVIVDDTNLSPNHFERMKQLASEEEVEVVDFTDVDIETCIERDTARQVSVGERVIRRMYNQFLKPKPPVITYNPKLYRAIICDLDGTLAHLNGRDPYDASTCENDLLNWSVYDILQTYFNMDYNIIFCSGREEKYRDQTKAWLKKHNITKRGEGGMIEYHKLYMRNTGDNRKDAIIKKEIYDTHIKGKYNVQFVLDDRNQVVDFWRSEGLTCLQVADGDF